MIDSVCTDEFILFFFLFLYVLVYDIHTKQIYRNKEPIQFCRMTKVFE